MYPHLCTLACFTFIQLELVGEHWLGMRITTAVICWTDIGQGKPGGRRQGAPRCRRPLQVPGDYRRSPTRLNRTTAGHRRAPIPAWAPGLRPPLPGGDFPRAPPPDPGADDASARSRSKIRRANAFRGVRSAHTPQREWARRPRHPQALPAYLRKSRLAAPPRPRPSAGGSITITTSLLASRPVRSASSAISATMSTTRARHTNAPCATSPAPSMNNLANTLDHQGECVAHQVGLLVHWRTGGHRQRDLHRQHWHGKPAGRDAEVVPAADMHAPGEQGEQRPGSGTVRDRAEKGLDTATRRKCNRLDFPL